MEEFSNKTFAAIRKFRPNLTCRQAQLDIVDLIIQILDNRNLPKTLLIEAATGIGKTLAYLIPSAYATLYNKGQMVISSNTKALQIQIEQELHMLSQIYEFSYLIIQGRSNYACKKLVDVTPSKEIQYWSQQSEYIDFNGTVQDFPLEPNLWGLIGCSQETCIKNRCEYFNGTCFYYMNRNKIDTSDILVVNHNLLLLDYALNGVVFSHKMQKKALTVVDEAHNLIRKAQSTFTHEIRRGGLQKLIKKINKAVQEDSDYDIDIEVYTEMEEKLFDLLPEQIGKHRIREFHAEAEVVAKELTDRLSNIAKHLFHIEFSNQAVSLNRRIQLYEKIFLNKNPSYVKYIDNSDSGTIGRPKRVCGIIPLDISSLMRNFFANKKKVLVSATLASGESDFTYLKSELGITSDILTEEKIYTSPFDPDNVGIYIPYDYIDPKNPKYLDLIYDQIYSILKIMQGRTLFLFVSRRDMNNVYFKLPINIRRNILRQKSTAESSRFVEAIKENQNLSIFGLETFGEGIDIPGQALSCVVIVKFPFSNRADFLVKSLIELFDADSSKKNFFMDYDLPRTLIKIRQYFGRLIRLENDKGILAILDNRFTQKGYKNKIVSIFKQYKQLSHDFQYLKDLLDI